MVLVELSVLGGVADLCITRDDTDDLRHCAIVPQGMLYHVAWEEANMAAINAIIDPHGGNRGLLLPLPKSEPCGGIQ